MDKKTQSILIGIGSAFAAVAVIVLLFFAISGLTGGNKQPGVSDQSKSSDKVQTVESDGKTVVLFDDDDEDEDEPTSSEQPVSSQPEVKQAAHFGRSDIDTITKGISTFADYVSAVSPVSYEWNTLSMGATGEVEVKLIASDGSYAIIGVPYTTDDTTIGGENHGSGSNVTEWSVYGASKSQESRVKAIVWLSNSMKFGQPRGVKIGTAYADITGAYLKLENPEKTYLLYEGTDVLKDASKLKAYKADKAAYIGGKVYRTSTLLNSFYAEDNDAYPFAKTSNNVIRYGFNSIEDTNETAGQWYMEYATKNSKVIGMYFHMSGADD